jgi:alanine dehydrogenase
MTLLLDENTVSELITMDDALIAVREGFVAQAHGTLANLPRVRLRQGGETVRITAAIAEHRGYFGVKVSSSAVFGSSAGRVLNLFESDTGRLCAVVQVFGLGAKRTGAVSGVAADCMANPDADVLAIVGTGRQARTQLAAMIRVRPIRQIRVFGRHTGRRADFADAARLTGADVLEFDTVEEAVTDAAIVVTATSASQPVLFGDWLSSGAHVSAIGANDESRRELDNRVVARADLIAVDEPIQARYESADLIQPVAKGILDWDQVSGLDELLGGSAPTRTSVRDITLFKSLGTAIGDVVLAANAYETAVERGVGVRLPELSGMVS